MSLSPPSSADTPPSSASAAPDRRLSVAELCVLVVVLACGALFAVVSAKDRLAQSRTDQMHDAAQAVSSWVSAAHQARLRGAVLEPDRCSITQHQPLSYCFSDMVSPGQPFAGLQNSFSPDAGAPAFAFIAVARAVQQGQPCSRLPDDLFLSAARGTSRQPPASWAGLVIIQTASFVDDLSVPVNKLNIGYCDADQTVRWLDRSVAF